MTFVEQIYLYLEGKLGGVVDFVLKALLALIIYFIARKLIQKLCTIIKKNMLKFRADEAITSFTVSLVKYSLNILLVLTIIVQLNIVKESSITAAIASAGVAISLALQGGLSNFAGGVLILLLKPFKVGDYIVFPNENQEGTVLKIEMYYTTISSVDNRTIMIPNANLTNSTIVNVTAMEKESWRSRWGFPITPISRRRRESCSGWWKRNRVFWRTRNSFLLTIWGKQHHRRPESLGADGKLLAGEMGNE